MHKYILNFSKGFVVYLLVFLTIVAGRGGYLKGLGPFLRVIFAPMEYTLETLNEVVSNPEGLDILNNGHLYDPNDSLPEKVNLLAEDLFLINTVYNDREPFLEIRNLKNDSVVENFRIPKEMQTKDYRQRFFTCINDDRSLIVVMTHEKNKLALFNLKNKRLIWTLKYDSMMIHHRVKFHNNQILCNIQKNREVNGVFFRDEGYAFIDSKSGRILKKWWLYDHIDEMDGIITYKGSERNQVNTFEGLPDKIKDYWHLNDVEVVNLKDDQNGTLQTNDILLSARNLNAILHLRKDSIISSYTGSFFKQHDVDVVDKNTISVFNNNSSEIFYPWIKKYSSNITYKDLSTEKESVAFTDIGLNTSTEGQFQKHGDYIYIENQNCHEVIIMKGNRIVYRGQLRNKKNGDKVNLLNWCTIFN